MVFGYINPSKEHPAIEQTDLLKQAGAKELIIEQPKGAKIKSIRLLQLLERIAQDDTLIFYSLKVLPLTTLEVIQVLDELNARKVNYQSLLEHFDDRDLFSILAAHLRHTRRIRSRYGIEVAKARGRNGGRKPGIPEEAQKTAWSAADLYKANKPIATIMAQLHIGSKATLYKYLRFAGVIDKKV